MEWLAALKEYEFAAGYCVEYYGDPTKYEKGMQDESFHPACFLLGKIVE